MRSLWNDRSGNSTLSDCLTFCLKKWLQYNIYSLCNIKLIYLPANNSGLFCCHCLGNRYFWRCMLEHTKRQVHKCKILQHALSCYVYNRSWFAFFTKIRVLDLRWRCFVDFSCGDAVFVNFFCGVAVFRSPPCPPLLTREDINDKLFDMI